HIRELRLAQPSVRARRGGGQLPRRPREEHGQGDAVVVGPASMRAIFWLLGLLNLANGLWMLLSPETWYHHLPAAVPDTGPLNVQFVRDIGAAFSTIGVAFLVAAPAAPRHRAVLLAATLFSGLPALVPLAA